jgi:hypothetical protein
LTGLSLTDLVRAAKKIPDGPGAAGYLNSLGLYVAVLVDVHSSDPREAFSFLGTLQHERVHWLQLIGTSVGLFGAYLNSLQAALLYQDWQTSPLSAMDLPLLDNARLTPDRRSAWAECEFQAIGIAGASRAYHDAVEAECLYTSKKVVSKQIRRLAVEALGSEGAQWLAFTDDVWSKATSGSHTLMFESRFGGLAANHLMDTVARINELVKASEYRGVKLDEFEGWEGVQLEVSTAAAFSPPYGLARDLYYARGDRTPSVANEMALCVLCDWALMYPPLPPLLPLGFIHGPSGITLSPGMVFAVLVEECDDLVLPSVTRDDLIGSANNVATAIYEHLESKSRIPTPLGIAAILGRCFSPLVNLTPSEAVYELQDDGGIPTPKSGLIGARLRYLTRQAAVAAQTRVANPAFFPLPGVFYRQDRSLFHELFDPLAPPMVSDPRQRFRPDVPDARWLTFFLYSAVAHDALYGSAFSTASELAQDLAIYSDTLLGAQNDNCIRESALEDVLGRGSASEVIARGLDGRSGAADHSRAHDRR